MSIIDLVQYIFKVADFNEYTAQISLRDPENKEKYIGTDENWEKAETYSCLCRRYIAAADQSEQIAPQPTQHPGQQKLFSCPALFNSPSSDTLLP